MQRGKSLLKKKIIILTFGISSVASSSGVNARDDFL